MRAPPASIFPPDALPPHRARARRRSASGYGARRAGGHHRRSTATPPTGTTSRTARSPGGARAGGDRGGLAPRAAIPGQVVVVDAGDLLQGDPFATYFARVAPTRPHPIIEAMNLAGYDAATPGNHDFDWGLPFLRRAVGRRALSLCERQPVRRPGRLAAVPAVSRRAAPGRAHRDHRLHHARHDGLGPRPARRPRAGRADRRRRPAPVLDGDAAGRRRRPWPWSTRGSAAARPTTRPAWATRTSAAALAGLPARPDVVVVGPLAPRDARLGASRGVHFVQPRPFGASVSVVHLDLAREDGVWRIAADPRGPGLHPRCRRRRRCWPSGSAPARDAVRAWARTAIGLAVGADARGRGAGRARPRSSTSCRTSSAGAPGARALGGVGLRPPGGVRRRHDPRGARARALSRSTTPCAPCG